MSQSSGSQSLTAHHHPQWTLLPSLFLTPSISFCVWFSTCGSISTIPPFCTTSVTLAATTLTLLLDELLSGILGMMTRLSTDGFRHSDKASKMPSLASPKDRSEEERQRTPSARFMKKLPEEEKPPEKLSPATTPKKPPSKWTRWNMLKCTYMMVTFLFVSYNKGDWCYCHHCNTEMDIRTDPCCSF
ncbi:epididymal protein 13 isoform X3 [Canis aureus]